MPSGRVIVRVGVEADSPAIGRIQQLAPEAAQWPLGDYTGCSLLVALPAEEECPVIVGFCAWRQTMPDEAELLNIAVHPGHRRQGVASALLNALAKSARGVIFLEVSQLNPKALHLYLKYGWEPVSIRKGYYGQGSINAVVMKKSTCYSPG
jgi:ribosomal-protein-alanine N-acetyltransferase